MAKDPYRYFRVEARELADQLSMGFLELERGAVGPEIIPGLLRLAHTLKGAARVVKQTAIGDHAHSIEGVLIGFREHALPLPGESCDVLLSLLDKIESQISTLDITDRAEPVAADKIAEEFFRVVRADTGDMEMLLDGVTETCAQVGSLRRRLTILEKARHLTSLLGEQLVKGRDGKRAANNASTDRAGQMAEELSGILGTLDRDLTTGCDRIDVELRQVRETAEHLRLVPASAVFTSLTRLVRDTAQSAGKQAVFKGLGGEVRIDTNVIAMLHAALLQLVRNAVAHGIESVADRTAAAKPPIGTVTLVVSRRGRRVAFACTDDGRGIDLEAIRRIAEHKGLVPEGTEAFDRNELLRVILQSGITTVREVSDVSGRGIGLDVVREAAARLGGDINIQTETGKGTTVEIVVPLSLTSLDALTVEVASAASAAAIPVDAVRQTLRLRREEITRAGGRESVLFEGSVIPFLPLRRVLSAKNYDAVPQSWSVVVVQGKSGMAAFGVDRIVGILRMVVRPLPEYLEQVPTVAGASLDAEGNPQLVLDPDGLVAQAQDPAAFYPEPPSRPDPILVIDDSLTTRMLEQSILESAGYEVEVATSGEEALGKARNRRYALFLVDVEMPGMDGFSFIQRIREDLDLRNIPAVLVTSRSSPEDRKKGFDVGAKGYVVKSEFDQNVLLRRIRELVK